jgi:hypothetical protein
MNFNGATVLDINRTANYSSSARRTKHRVRRAAARPFSCGPAQRRTMVQLSNERSGAHADAVTVRCCHRQGTAELRHRAGRMR